MTQQNEHRKLGRPSRQPVGKLGHFISEHLEDAQITRYHLANIMDIAPSTLGRLIYEELAVKSLDSDLLSEALRLNAAEHKELLRLLKEAGIASTSSAGAPLHTFAPISHKPLTPAAIEALRRQVEVLALQLTPQNAEHIQRSGYRLLARLGHQQNAEPMKLLEKGPPDFTGDNIPLRHLIEQCIGLMHRAHELMLFERQTTPRVSLAISILSRHALTNDQLVQLEIALSMALYSLLDTTIVVDEVTQQSLHIAMRLRFPIADDFIGLFQPIDEDDTVLHVSVERAINIALAQFYPPLLLLTRVVLGTHS